MSISIIRYQAMMSYSVELSDTKLRFILGMMPNIYYGLGYSCLTLIAYLTQSWVGIFRVSLVLQGSCLLDGMMKLKKFSKKFMEKFRKKMKQKNSRMKMN